MVNTENRDRKSRTLRVAGTILAALAFAGCASQAAQVQADATTAKGNRDAAGKLYEGEPAAVHGTEYPVMSAAEGLAQS